MKHSIIACVLALILNGCSTTPRTLAECPSIFDTAEDIAACETRVIRNEDSRHRAKMKREERENCRWPMVWESTMGGYNGRCVEASMNRRSIYQY